MHDWIKLEPSQLSKLSLSERKLNSEPMLELKCLKDATCSLMLFKLRLDQEEEMSLLTKLSDLQRLQKMELLLPKKLNSLTDITTSEPLLLNKLLLKLTIKLEMVPLLLLFSLELYSKRVANLLPLEWTQWILEEEFNLVLIPLTLSLLLWVFQFKAKKPSKTSLLSQLMETHLSVIFSLESSIDSDKTELLLFKMEKLSKPKLNTSKVLDGIEVSSLHTLSLIPKLAKLNSISHWSFFPIKRSAVFNLSWNSWNMLNKTKDNS